ncbi:hypothetical protein SNEBB_005888 [Seison nebaliae]|nr:hypothetical protein SNEBB_005888 [Seison nebaliae]
MVIYLYKILLLLIIIKYVKSITWPSTCGIKAGSRIVGGTVAEPHEFPWQVSLRYRGSHICGGTIIHERLILTAVHCVNKMNYKSFSIVVGIKNLHDLKKYRRNVKVIAVGTPSGYKVEPRNFWKDIALLKLACALPLVRTVPKKGELMPACLPTSTMEFQNEDCWASGWGAKVFGGNVQPLLHKAKLKLYSTYICNRIDKHKDKLCTSSRAERTGTCHGDSGGPIACIRNDKYYVAGVVSMGVGSSCFTEEYYTKVSVYRKWIIDIAENWNV